MKYLKTTMKFGPGRTTSIGILAMSFLLFQNAIIAQNADKGKTLLAVFAHPDDEGTVAPILAKYVEEGVKVYLVIATDGRYGTNDFSGLEAGDGLVAIRKEEMKCSANKLGVELIHLNYHDQLRAAEGYGGHIPHVRALVKEIYDIIEKTQPDAIITFGADGWSNHMDHRLVGASVTQAFISKVWEKPINLYYVGTPTDAVEDAEGKILRGQDRKYLTTQVRYSEENQNTAYDAFACHESQISPEWIKKMKEEKKPEEERVVYLWEFVGPTEVEDSVFN